MTRTEPGGTPTWRRCTLLLIASLGLAGCFPPSSEGGEPPDAFCGFLYSCGSDSDTNRGGEHTETGTSNNDSNSTSNNNNSDDNSDDTTGGE
jgi:hypothetical protein